MCVARSIDFLLPRATLAPRQLLDITPFPCNCCAAKYVMKVPQNVRSDRATLQTVTKTIDYYETLYSFLCVCECVFVFIPFLCLPIPNNYRHLLPLLITKSQIVILVHPFLCAGVSLSLDRAFGFDAIPFRTLFALFLYSTPAMCRE